MPGRLTVVLAAALLLTGCMISEQDGQLRNAGNPRFVDTSLQDVAFHFQSPLNVGVVVGRSLLLALLGLWFFRLGTSPVPRILAALCGLAAVSLVAAGLPTLLHYRIEAYESGLTLRLPPQPERRIAWDEIESLDVEGLIYGNAMAGGRRDSSPFSPNLREWHTMQLRLADGDTIEMDLRPLSIEQRETVWRAIVGRAELRQVK